MLSILFAAILSLIQQPAQPKTAMGPSIIVQGPEPALVRILDAANVVIEVEGSADCEILAPPNVKNLDIQIGPRQSQVFSSFDGKKMRTRSTSSFSIYLKPLVEGVFEVPFLSVRVGAETFKTRALRFEAVKDITGSKNAFLEITASKKMYYVNEPIRVTIRIGIDQAIYSYLLQIFGRRFDLPVQVEAPWLDEFPGGVPIETNAPQHGEQMLTMVANRSQATIRSAGTVLRDGRTFLTFELDRAWIPGRFGETTLSTSVLRFQFATRVTRNAFGESVAADRNDGRAMADSLKLEIRPIPEDGRPANYSSAVGKFKIFAEASPHDLKVGESLKVKLRIEGEGNIEFLDPPKLDGLDGFHVYGKIDEKKRNERFVTYDLSPLSENVKQIPAISFSYFDTDGEGTYKTISTNPIPITVRPLPPGSGLAPLAEDASKRAVAGVDDIFDMKPVANNKTGKTTIPGAGAAALAFGFPMVLAAGVFVILRRRENDAANPARVRARGAMSQFKKSLASGADPAAAFTTYLSNHLNCPDAAIVSSDLTIRLEARGISKGLAGRAAAAILQNVEARYSKGSVSAGGGFDKLADELEREFMQ
ncbi:MAG: BatD family protein [Planctomycetota bacterium]